MPFPIDGQLGGQSVNSSVQQLEATGTALRVALAEQDWAAIGKLDQQCRLAVNLALADNRDQEQLRQSMENLLGLYQELVSTCQSEQRRLAGELVQLNQAQQGAKIYQFFS
jgi:flagellar protein FliT